MSVSPKSLLPPVSVRASEQFGRVLRRWRKAKKMTQADLAKKAGLTQKTISHIESGTKTAELVTILSVCTALDLEIVIRERPQTMASSSRLNEMFGTSK